MSQLFGWTPRPDQVEKILPTLRIPEMKGNAPTLDTKKDTFLYRLFRKLTGKDAPKGPQGIGDCVSWAWGNLVNYLQALQAYQKAKELGLLGDEHANDPTRIAIVNSYEETATESIYALSRCEIGDQYGSYQDGSCGIWAAQAVVEKGTLSRPWFDRKGLQGEYSAARAKEWGAKGLPDEYEPGARQHLVKTTSIVRSFDDAAALCQNGYPTAVCSDQGFTTERDADGFCAPYGTWYHAMLFMAVRFGRRPGMCLSQSWGPNNPTGPLAFDQPDNSFWVDAHIVDKMLRQADSFTGSQFMNYKPQDFTGWHH